MSDVRAAAESLRDHAWLERFRKANYDNSFNLLSPTACNDIARYVDKFIDTVLAEHPADDDVELDQDWIEANCHRKLDTDDDLYEWVIFGETVLLLDKYGRTMVSRTMVSQIEDGATRIISVDTVQLRDCNTRGDVRRLLRALGVEVRE